MSNTEANKPTRDKIMDRTEHLNWCKDRALAYVDAGDNQQAMSSMISDLSKHKDTENSAKIGFSLGMFAMQSGSTCEMRRFINGFN